MKDNHIHQLSLDAIIQNMTLTLIWVQQPQWKNGECFSTHTLLKHDPLSLSCWAGYCFGYFTFM